MKPRLEHKLKDGQIIRAELNARPGLARILLPARADQLARQELHGDAAMGIATETGSPFSGWCPYAEALTWAQELVEQWRRPVRIVVAGDAW
ncbi:hypothetical protein [Brevundimonas vancanneytii]|uniref:Uncharacterized protein n=1 Tax=Brevundimonas vancanneytii TaxID=1325724 RepID=A0A4P1K2G7_9CAUL|nr:hypothetical protein [Brevundimonas vancanneytii]VTO13981.1 Uncharacterised protein [Brevundimonas vancanneytii]